MIPDTGLVPGCVRRAGELTSSVAVAQVGKTPHVAQSYAVPDAGEQELVLASPLLPRQRVGLGDDGAGKVALWQRLWRCGPVAVLGDGVPVQVR